jgi:hypothetical protein
MTLSGPDKDMFTLTGFSSEFDQYLSLAQGAELLPDQSYSVSVTGQDTAQPASTPVTNVFTVTTPDTSFTASGEPEAWAAVDVAQMLTDDPFAETKDSYGYSVAGETAAGADFFFQQGSSTLRASNMTSANLGDLVNVAVNENIAGAMHTQTETFMVGQQADGLTGVAAFTLHKVA